jgi:hypothetical protein
MPMGRACCETCATMAREVKQRNQRKGRRLRSRSKRLLRLRAAHRPRVQRRGGPSRLRLHRPQAARRVQQERQGRSRRHRRRTPSAEPLRRAKMKRSRDAPGSGEAGGPVSRRGHSSQKRMGGRAPQCRRHARYGSARGGRDHLPPYGQ